MEKNKQTSPNPVKKQSFFCNIIIIIGLTLVISLIFSSIQSSQNKTVRQHHSGKIAIVQQTREDQIRLEKENRLLEIKLYNKKLEMIFQNAYSAKVAADKKSMAKFEESLSKEIEHYNPPIEKVIDNMTSITATKNLCYAMVMDKIDSTFTAQQILNSKTEPIRDSIDEAHINIEAALRILSVDLQSNFNKMLSSIDRGHNKLTTDPSLPQYLRSHLQSQMEDTETLVNDIAIKSALAGISLPIDLYIFLPVVKKAVQASLGGIVRNAVSRMSIGTFLTILDGPLPIGDIVAGIMALYTGYELYDARVNMQDELRKNLYDASENFKEIAHKEALHNAQGMLISSQILTHTAITAGKKSFLKKNQ